MEFPAKNETRIKDLKEISIAIDTWDDILSDFDPRPYDVRDLSEDFISEIRKRYRESRTGSFLVTITAPQTLAHPPTEKTIVQRIKKHFRRRALRRQKQIAQIRLRGFIFVGCGILSLSLLTLITYYNLLSKLGVELIGIVLMPLGWFGIWEGFSKIVDTSPAFIDEQELFRKLSTASFRFRFIDDEKST